MYKRQVDVVLMATGNDLKMLATPGEAQLQRAHEALALSLIHI